MTTNFSDKKSAQVQQLVTGGDVTYIGSSQIFGSDEQGNAQIEDFPGFYVLTRNGETEAWGEKTGWEVI